MIMIIKMTVILKIMMIMKAKVARIKNIDDHDDDDVGGSSWRHVKQGRSPPHQPDGFHAPSASVLGQKYF